MKNCLLGFVLKARKQTISLRQISRRFKGGSSSTYPRKRSRRIQIKKHDFE